MRSEVLIFPDIEICLTSDVNRLSDIKHVCGSPSLALAYCESWTLQGSSTPRVFDISIVRSDHS